MRIVIEYTSGCWEFTVEKLDGDVDSFEILELEEAKQVVSDLLREQEEDYDPLDDVFDEDN